MAEVSRRAGVGMATLYRNFADRRELLEAVYIDEVDAVVAAASTVGGATDGARLDAWLREFFAFITSKRRVAAGLLEHTDRSDAVFGGSRARVTAAGLPLFHAAQAAGQVRDDLNFDQVIDMVHAIAKVPGDRRTVEPMLQTVLDGLGTRPHPRESGAS